MTSECSKILLRCSSGKVTWVHEVMDISNYANNSFKLRYVFKSEDNGVMNGWYIDNIKISKYGVTDVEDAQQLPIEFSLAQNYPNPFNPSTVIKFSLPEDVANVKLSIYMGEKVAELVNTSLMAGKYLYQWNAQNVATGMYIYELRTDNFVSVKKMVLMK